MEKPKPKTQLKAKHRLTDKEQSERFIETARQLGVEKTGTAFDAAFIKIVSKKV